jgi:hypothetical protein
MEESSATLVDLTSSEMLLDVFSEPTLGAFSPYSVYEECSFQYDKWQTDHIYQLQMYVHTYMSSYSTGDAPFWRHQAFYGYGFWPCSRAIRNAVLRHKHRDVSRNEVEKCTEVMQHIIRMHRSDVVYFSNTQSRVKSVGIVYNVRTIDAAQCQRFDWIM